MLDGELQTYGTQFTLVDGRPEPCAVADPERMDQRRAEVGLEPLAVHLARFQAGS